MMTKQQYLDLADSVVERLEAWLAKPPQQRTEPVPESLFREALQTVKQMRAEVQDNRRFARGKRGRALTRSIVDCLTPRAAPVAAKIMEDAATLEKEYDDVA